MRLFLAFALVTFAVPDRPSPDPTDATPPSLQIFGDWQYLRDRNTVVPGLMFRILPGETQWLSNGKVSPDNGFTAKAILDPTKTPATIDMMPRRGGQTLYGIWKMEGDRLTLAWSNNQTRPVDFVAPHNIHHFVRARK